MDRSDRRPGAGGGRQAPRLAAQTFSGALSWAESSPLLLGATLAPGQDAEQARAAMAGVLDGLAAEPVTAEELERALGA